MAALIRPRGGMRTSQYRAAIMVNATAACDELYVLTRFHAPTVAVILSLGFGVVNCGLFNTPSSRR
jgi:hypothetical protein